jgi:pantoate kinase
MADRTVFVPGHITGFFTVEEGEDPTDTGSQGAGLTLTHGVRVRVEAAEHGNTLVYNGESIEVEPVARVLDALGVTAAVTAQSDVPMGAGFGVSGALALGTAMAANRAFDCRLSENELVTIAHGAEVQSGTGLGDVVAQARGGMPIRLEPGDPQNNLLDGIPGRFRVEYLTLGERATRSELAGDNEQLNRAGEEALSRVVKDPTLSQFMYASRRFAREADLLSDEVRDIIEAVNQADGEAAMAMLGDTIFAAGTGLTDAGYDPSVCRTSRMGAGFE